MRERNEFSRYEPCDRTDRQTDMKWERRNNASNGEIERGTGGRRMGTRRKREGGAPLACTKYHEDKWLRCIRILPRPRDVEEKLRRNRERGMKKDLTR